jgi:ceramide synthetase
MLSLGRRALQELSEGSSLNQGLTAGFLALAAYEFIILFVRDKFAFFEFLFLFPVVWLLSKTFYSLFGSLARFLNERVFTHGSNARVFDIKKQHMKFCDQGWQLVLHTISVAIELPTLLREGILADLTKCWIPCPVDQTCPPLMQFAYFFVLSAYTFAGFQHRFFSPRKRDYYVMFGHHIATCALITGSYVTRCYRIGLAVMFVHDISDILLDITQLMNHAKMEGRQFYFVTEISFVFAMIGWFVSRIYYLPVKLIGTILTDCHRLCALKYPGQFWRYPFCERTPFWHGGIILLSLLVVMHTWWFYLGCKILVKVALNDGVNKSDVYEADLVEKKKRQLADQH